MKLLYGYYRIAGVPIWSGGICGHGHGKDYADSHGDDTPDGEDRAGVSANQLPLLS